MIKVVIFDFDFTMYIGSIGNEGQLGDKLAVENSLGKEAYKYLDKKYCIHTQDIKDVINYCKKEGMDYKRVAQEFCDHPFIHQIREKLEIIPNEFLKALSDKCNIYIASMSQKKYLDRYFDLYDIDKTCIKDVICLELLLHDSKADLYKIIMEKEKVMPSETLMIGDNPVHDIQPAQKLGMNTLLFNKQSFNQIYDYMTKNNILDCKQFKQLHKFIYNKKESI